MEGMPMELTTLQSSVGVKTICPIGLLVIVGAVIGVNLVSSGSIEELMC